MSSSCERDSRRRSRARRSFRMPSATGRTVAGSSATDAQAQGSDRLVAPCLQGTGAMRYQVDIYTDADQRRGMLEDDVRRGLTAPHKCLPPKYFYDRVGSVLFERITTLPEY